MRITRLDLLRFGKFTDKTVQLPCAKQDFHLIVGPNEAGKSTLRDAIQDLLFGIETRSSYNFLHPHNEMRVGALIEEGGNLLDFIRTKARSKTLQTPNGAALPDNALMHFLGQVERKFFDQMFGLNHARLVKGGQEILSASDDVGQILFQAAAGIGSLGTIRDKLEQEADGLWGPRKSDKREYYLAAAELEQAETMLKQTTVRTKEWQEASSAVDVITTQLSGARNRYETLTKERFQLERIRRVAPMLTTLSQVELQLTELGPVVSLPDDAAQQLTKAEHEVAIATQSPALFESQSNVLSAKIATLAPNEAVLARAADIEALCATRQLLRNVEGDIAARESEIQVIWQDIQDLTRQLGWPDEEEAAVNQRLPGGLVRASIDALVRRHDALAQAQSAANESLRTRQEEIKVFDAELALLPATAIPVVLTAALAQARSMGDVALQTRKAETQIARLQRELDTAQAALGAWNPEVEALRKVLAPTQDEINALMKTRADLELTNLANRDRLAEVSSSQQALQLEIAQYKAAQQPVTFDDVLQSRTGRDALWQEIKGGTVTLGAAAPGFEQAIYRSDALSDQRHDKAQEETELQGRFESLQRLQQQLTDLTARAADTAQALTHFDQVWSERISDLGLSGMALLQVNDWRGARERVLSAAAALAEAQAAQQDFAQAVATAQTELLSVMQVLEPDAHTFKLAALILLADDLVSTSTRAQERRQSLVTQKTRSELTVTGLSHQATQAQAALATWQMELQKNLALAHLPLDSNIGAVTGALAIFERINLQLQKIRETRVNRVDMMRRDLDSFALAAKALASDIAPGLAADTPSQISLSLDAQLKQHAFASLELGRLQQELAQAAIQVAAANEKQAQARASLEPLLRLSKTTSNDELRIAAANSDQLRTLTAEMGQALRQLLSAGDGLDRAALSAEWAATDADATATSLDEIKRQTDEVVELQSSLSSTLSSAAAVLGKIAGQSEAARAESQRQQALARMGNALERFIKVFTAAKLLRWSIEKFRETKQGPMLARASDVFAGLTQGAFSKLVVDYEHEPLKLSGQRTTGERVEIEGMSEGTRDQLYLALRLAALELHLEKTIALPFIADDLFINYDDGRARAGLQALAKLSESTQVIFLSHHAHLVPVAQSVFGDKLNVVHLS